MIDKKLLDKFLNYLQRKCDVAAGCVHLSNKNPPCSDMYLTDQIMENNNRKTLLTNFSAYSTKLSTLL